MLNPIFEYKIYHPSLQSYSLDRGHAQTMWTAMGGGGQRNVQSTNKAYLVKLSTKGGQKSPKNGPHGLCTTPNVILILVHR